MPDALNEGNILSRHTVDVEKRRLDDSSLPSQSGKRAPSMGNYPYIPVCDGALLRQFQADDRPPESVETSRNSYLASARTMGERLDTKTRNPEGETAFNGTVVGQNPIELDHLVLIQRPDGDRTQGQGFPSHFEVEKGSDEPVGILTPEEVFFETLIRIREGGFVKLECSLFGWRTF